MRISFEYRNIWVFKYFSKNDFSICYYVYACSFITVVICRVFGLTLEGMVCLIQSLLCHYQELLGFFDEESGNLQTLLVGNNNEQGGLNGDLLEMMLKIKN